MTPAGWIYFDFISSIDSLDGLNFLLSFIHVYYIYPVRTTNPSIIVTYFLFRLLSSENRRKNYTKRSLISFVSLRVIISNRFVFLLGRVFTRSLRYVVCSCWSCVLLNVFFYSFTTVASESRVNQRNSYINIPISNTIRRGTKQVNYKATNK